MLYLLILCEEFFFLGLSLFDSYFCEIQRWFLVFAPLPTWLCLNYSNDEFKEDNLPVENEYDIYAWYLIFSFTSSYSTAFQPTPHAFLMFSSMDSSIHDILFLLRRDCEQARYKSCEINIYQAYVHFLISSMLILFLKSSFFTPTGFKRILIYDSRDRMMRQGKTLTDCRFRIGNMLLVTLKFENKKN